MKLASTTSSRGGLAVPRPGTVDLCRARGARGFTLIELLVVVAILALLVSILLPSLAAARQQSRRLVCLTHLHTWASAAQMYANAHKGFIPRDYGYTQGLYVENGGQWHVCPAEVLSPFMAGARLPLVPLDKDPFVFMNPNALTNANAGIRDEYLAVVFLRIESLQCPSFPNTRGAIRLATGDTISEQPLDYVTNGYVLDDSFNTEGGGLTKIETIPLPSRLIYVTEANQKNTIENFGFHDVYADNDAHLWSGTTAHMIADNRHPGSATSSASSSSNTSNTGTVVIGFANAMMFDGHVETLRIDQITRKRFTLKSRS